MLSTNTSLINSLSQDTSVKAVPKVLLEYNMNDMAYSVDVIGNHGSASNIIKKLFPPSSVVKPFRPTKSGIRYAIFGDSIPEAVYNSKTGDVVNSKGVASKKSYMADEANTYKYFLTQGNGSLAISYKNKSGAAQNILANKFVIKVENNHSSSTISVSFAGKTVYSGSVPANGVIETIYNGTSWSTSNTTYGAPDSASSVSATVTTSGFAGVIEISPRYVIDITDRVTSVDIQKEDSIKNDLMPVGMLTANSAVIELSTISNGDIVRFIKGDTITSSSVMLAKDAKCTISFLINDTHTIQQGIFYINTVSQTNYGNYSISCLDSAKFLQEVSCPEIVIANAPFQTIIWRILDAVGFNNYNFTNCTGDIFTSLYWWGEKTKTAWQAIQELCRESQTVAYFDEYGTLKFYDRTFFQNSKPIAWTFNYDQDGSKKPDIVDIKSDINPEIKDLKISYSIPMTPNQPNSSQPLWTEPAPSTLFAGPYMGIESSGGREYLKYAHTGVFSRTIPTRFNSYVLLEREIIEYDAIQYAYPGGVKDVESYGEFLDLYAQHTVNLQQTGKLRIKVGGRNLFGTSTTQASPNNSIASIIASYSAQKYVLNGGAAVSASVNSIVANETGVENSSALKMSASTSKNDLYLIYKNLDYANAAISQVGTAIGFDLQNNTNTGIQQTAGLAVNWNAATTTGYLIIMSTTKSAQDSNDKTEVSLNKIVSGSVVETKSIESNIFEYGFYGIDVLIKRESGKNTVKVYINGSIIELVDSSSPLTSSAGVALVVGGQSTAYFDYLYSGERETFEPDFIASRSRGQLISSAFFEKFTYTDTIASKFYYTEFGDVIREVYKGRAEYSQAYPVLLEPTNRLAKVVASRLSNYKGDFFIMNTSSSTLPLASSSGDELVLYGNAIANAGQNVIEISNSSADSNKVLTVDIQWLQTKESVQKLADFLSTFWSKNNMSLDLEVFGNPIIDIGDIVSVKYPELNLAGTERFIVRSVKQKIEGGLTTNVSLHSIYLS